MATQTKSATSTKPKTMEELLAQTKSEIIVPQKGQSINGKVKLKNKKSLIVDIGAKTEGVVTDKEYELAADYIEELKEGDKVEAVVLSAVTDRGQILLSLKQAALDAKWEIFEEALKNDTALEAKGIEVNKGGLIVIVEGMRGFVPSSQFGKEYIGNIKALKGATIKVKPIEVDAENNRLIFSERHVSEAEELELRDQALESVTEGATYEGVVSGAMPFGLFVTVEVRVGDKPKDAADDHFGHVEGLIHISEISWEKVQDPRDYHKVGDRIKVKVLGIDDENGKLNLSLKQLSTDPWVGIAEKYPVGTTFAGTVSRVESFGIFVNVEAGVDGLIHASKLTGSENFTKGEEITVTVESVEPDQRRMSLSPVSTEVPVGYK
jgi:small subunit ribosomal protein S1